MGDEEPAKPAQMQQDFTPLQGPLLRNRAKCTVFRTSMVIIKYGYERARCDGGGLFRTFLRPSVGVAELSDRFYVLRGDCRSLVRPRVAQEGGERCDLIVGQAILVALHSHLHWAFFS